MTWWQPSDFTIGFLAGYIVAVLWLRFVAWRDRFKK